ncbi:MAG TPA: CheR family methyltransferase [Solirubrobacteraceae bacterium]|nr:CheR family methyltransferase [Solirubrobacteraceae bacterium]
MSALETDSAFEALLEFLKRSRGFDLTGYKRTSLERRFRRRMDAVGCGSHDEYLDYLEVNPEEHEQLFDTLLINVTEFFRDPAMWQHLREQVVPGMLEAKPAGEQIRVWSAGCASGQEAYTAAIVLAELLGIEEFLERVKIYATDVDEDALTVARHAVYSRKEVESVPEELRERYFERADQRLAFRKDLRRSVIFGRNNLISDAPISRLDLLICRNTLMYFTAETQGRILRHFHFALRDDGVLMLGKSEMMISHRDVFAPLDLKRRLFRKHDRPFSIQARLAGMANDQAIELPTASDERSTRDAALDLGPHGQLIVSREGILTFANLPARALFGVGLADIGRPLADLGLARNPAPLKPAIDEAMAERRRVVIGELRFAPREGDERQLDVTVVPLLGEGGPAVGASVVFEDVGRYVSMRKELEGNRRDLELAYEELQSTIDELETTNEELQSANEELQTTNEELQSTNEELETMNEELQSTNEELETINDELRDRTSELNQVNDFLEGILSSLGVAVAVVDRQQRVQVWNQRAEDLWGVRQDEAVDHHLLSLDIGLPVEQLAAPLRSVLGGASEKEEALLEAVNRRGRSIGCATTIMPLLSARSADGQVVSGAIVMMADGDGGMRD